MHTADVVEARRVPREDGEGGEGGEKDAEEEGRARPDEE